MESKEEFKNAYNNCYNEFLNELKLEQEIEETIARNSLIKQCISKLTSSKTNYPIIVGNILTRASITNIGTFPPYKYNEKYIYPLNYTVKKRFRAHRNYKKSPSNKVLYVCKIESDGISIISDDGYVWKGNEVWGRFKEDTQITDEFQSIEDFMALNHHLIGKMVEEIGDISTFNNYVPLVKRSNKEK